MFGTNNDGSQADNPIGAPHVPESSSLEHPTPNPISSPATQPSSLTAPVMPRPGDDPNDLLALKQKALKDLTPLVSHLDQTPEEKFKTTMMMIQASDNPDLVEEAYHAAQQINDVSERAQALIDVVNEINYFTQKNSKS